MTIALKHFSVQQKYTALRLRAVRNPIDDCMLQLYYCPKGRLGKYQLRQFGCPNAKLLMPLGELCTIR
jgi:hypothetical protein